MSVFRRRKPEDDFAAALYKRVAEQARMPRNCSRTCGIPDTLDGRFDSLALHAALVIDRLRREPDGEALSQAFFDAMFRHLDLTLREIGIQDLGVGRRIKIMAEGLHGRAPGLSRGAERWWSDAACRGLAPQCLWRYVASRIRSLWFGSRLTFENYATIARHNGPQRLNEVNS